MLRSVALAALLISAFALHAADKPDVEAVRKRVREAESKLADLRAELAKAEGEPTEFTPAKSDLRVDSLKIGQSGKFNSVQSVKEVLDDDSLLAWVDFSDHSEGVVVIRGVPTKGLIDDNLIHDPKTGDKYMFGVVGTEKRGAKTVAVVRPLPLGKVAELKVEPKPKK